MDWLGATIGGIFGYKGQRDQDVASAQQAQKQMDFQRDMSNTAVQRRMADLKKAGINPILAGSKEASSPGGAMAPMGNRAKAAIESASAKQALLNLSKTGKLIDAQRLMQNTNSAVANLQGRILRLQVPGYANQSNYDQSELGKKMYILHRTSNAAAPTAKAIGGLTGLGIAASKIGGKKGKRNPNFGMFDKRTGEIF
jgi:hypothetical protein